MWWSVAAGKRLDLFPVFLIRLSGTYKRGSKLGMAGFHAFRFTQCFKLRRVGKLLCNSWKHCSVQYYINTLATATGRTEFIMSTQLPWQEEDWKCFCLSVQVGRITQCANDLKYICCDFFFLLKINISTTVSKTKMCIATNPNTNAKMWGIKRWNNKKQAILTFRQKKKLNNKKRRKCHKWWSDRPSMSHISTFIDAASEAN